MKRNLIRYTTQAEQADTNQQLIEAVFAELKRTQPKGVSYLVLRLPDSSFQHFVSFESDTDSSPITGLESFRKFRAGVNERCVTGPVSNDVTIVGSYGMVPG